MNRLIIIYILISLTFPVYVEAQKVLKLEDVIILAQDSSAEGIKARKSFDVSHWQFLNYRAERLPSLNFSLTPMEYNRNVVKRYISETDRDEYRSQKIMSSYGSLKLLQNIDFLGGQFYAISELGFLRTFSTNTYNQFSSTPIRVGYSQKLLGYNDFKWERKIEPLKYKISERAYQYALGEIAERTTTYFFDVLEGKEKLSLAELNKQRTDTLVKLAQIKYANNALVRSDLLTLQITNTEMGNNLALAHRAYNQALSRLLSFVCIDKVRDDFSVLIPKTLPYQRLNPDMILSRCKENNPLYLEMQQNILGARRELDKMKKQQYVNSQFNISVGFNQYSDRFQQAYKELMRQDFVSIGITIPLIDWGKRKASYSIVKSNLELAEVEEKRRLLDLEQEILAKVSDYNIRVDMLKTSEETTLLAKKVVEETVLKFKYGANNVESFKNALIQEQQAYAQYLSMLKSCWLDYMNICKETLHSPNLSSWR
jgi:hypothetical protein